MGDAHLFIVGVFEAKPSGDLLGGVVVAKPLEDDLAKLGAELELGRARSAGPAPGLVSAWWAR
jgi:hypothetical protein